MINRRQILQQVSLGAAGAGAVAAFQPLRSPVLAQSTQVRWRMATSWPQSLDIVFGAVERFCERVSELTAGNFTITPFAAGEIVPGLQVLDAVQEGTVQCGHSASYYYIGKNPSLAFGTTVPFGLTPQQQNAWFYHGGGIEIMHQLYSDFGVISFPAGNTSTQMGGWFKQEINTVEDLQGLKMRIPGLGGQVMAQLGVNVQVLPGGEIFLALDRGAIDAAEWVGPYDDTKLGLNDAADFYYYPGWWEPGTAYELEINLDAWNELPAEYQAVIRTAAYELNTDMLAQYDAENGPALQALVDGGTQLVPYSQEIMAAAEQASIEFLEENAREDSTFRQIYDTWKQFRTQLYGWHEVNQLSFSRFAFPRA